MLLPLSRHERARRVYAERLAEGIWTSRLAARALVWRAAGLGPADFAVEPLPEWNWHPLPAREAFLYFKDKIPISSEAFRALEESARQYAFSVANVQELDALAAVKEGVLQAIERGTTLRDFDKVVVDILTPDVYAELKGWHVETIFRTNIHQAYNSGQYEQLHDPDVKEAFPVYRYDTVGDDRVREEHQHMDGVTLPADDPLWDKWWPPNGYNCRCTIVPIAKKKAKGLQMTERSSLWLKQPSPGFEGAPIRQAAQKIESIGNRETALLGELRGGIR